MSKRLIDMVIEAMDPDEIRKKFHQLCSHGIDADGFMKFLEYLLPWYESNKKEVFTEIIRAAYTALIDGIWNDPGDIYLYSRLNELKKLSDYFNIKIEKEDAV